MLTSHMSRSRSGAAQSWDSIQTKLLCWFLPGLLDPPKLKAKLKLFDSSLFVWAAKQTDKWFIHHLIVIHWPPQRQQQIYANKAEVDGVSNFLKFPLLFFLLIITYIDCDDSDVVAVFVIILRRHDLIVDIIRMPSVSSCIISACFKDSKTSCCSADRSLSVIFSILPNWRLFWMALRRSSYSSIVLPKFANCLLCESLRLACNVMHYNQQIWCWVICSELPASKIYACGTSITFCLAAVLVG